VVEAGAFLVPAGGAQVCGEVRAGDGEAFRQRGDLGELSACGGTCRPGRGVGRRPCVFRQRGGACGGLPVAPREGGDGRCERVGRGGLLEPRQLAEEPAQQVRRASVGGGDVLGDGDAGLAD
jgi:hypothetical protein